MQQVRLASFMLPDPAPIGELTEIIAKLAKLGVTKVAISQFERGLNKHLSIEGFQEEPTPIELGGQIDYIFHRMDELEQKVNRALIQLKPQTASHDVSSSQNNAN